MQRWYDRFCRYAGLHARSILIPDDALRDKLAGEGGHVKLWAAVERVQEELVASESGYKDDLLERQEQYAGTAAALAQAVDKFASYTDLEKARSCTAIALTSASTKTKNSFCT